MLNMYTETVDLIATGKRIEYLRKSRGYSVAEIAQYMGFTGPQAVYKWQKGLCLPDVVNFIALGRLFGVTVEDMVVMKEAGDEPASFIYLLIQGIGSQVVLLEIIGKRLWRDYFGVLAKFKEIVFGL